MTEQMMSDFDVGDGATVAINGDYYPYTVIAKVGRRIYVQADTPKCIKRASAYGADDAVFQFDRNPSGEVKIFSLRKNGRFRQVGWGQNEGFSLTKGRSYRKDPHF